MRFPRVVIAPVLAAVLWASAAAPLLPSSGGGLMPCCEGGSPCDTALQATGCCRIDATTDWALGLAAAITRSSGSYKAYLPQAPAVPGTGALAQPPVRTVVALAGESPPHTINLPLYLLNAALLR